MSNSTPPYLPERLRRLREAFESESVRQVLRLVGAPLRFVGFWLAVTLPFLYLPLLYGGLTGEQGVVFAALLGLNAVALVVGHGYQR